MFEKVFSRQSYVKEADLAYFQSELLNYHFNDPNLLLEALTHSSFANENPDLHLKDNERLEFLGDSVLACIISRRLYLDEQCLPEGDMTKLRSLLVREETLASIGAEIKLQEFLLLGQGEEKTSGRQKSSNVENALEALIAAIFLDSNLENCAELIAKLFSQKISQAMAGDLIYDYKSYLLEYLQGEGTRQDLQFRLLKEAGPPHERTFTVAVEYQGQLYEAAQKSSKRAAEQEAARLFLLAEGIISSLPL